MTDVYSDSSILLIDSHWLMIQSIYMHRKLSKSLDTGRGFLKTSDIASDSYKRVRRTLKLGWKYIRPIHRHVR